MANIMTKRGTQDNVVTYEHMCDSHDDLANIPQNQITLGSIAIVLKDNDNQIGVYMADSNKEWLSLLTMGGNSNSNAPSTVDLLHVLTANEYDAVTHIPTIASPETNIVYLVPSTNLDDNNLFDEWIYTGENWERFGGASVSANIQPDWEQNDANAADYIKNRICYTDDHIEETLVDAICEKQKVEGMPFDAFQIMYTSESPISFDYNENDIFEFSYAGKVYYKGVLESDGPGLLNPALTDEEEIPPDTYAIDLSNNTFFIGSARSSTYNLWPDSGRFVVKHIGSHIEKLNPKYLPFNIRAGDNKGIVEGNIADNIASGLFSHALGLGTEASGFYSHALGENSIASGDNSHALGTSTEASEYSSHALGVGSVASGQASHALGSNTEASGTMSHALGINTEASGDWSHVLGYNTIANHRSQHVFGLFNINDPNSAISSNKGNYIEIVGNGTSNNARSNARTLDWNGNEWLAGNITLEGSMNRGRATNTTIGPGSFAFGLQVTASGSNSHALGFNTTASGSHSHALGYQTTASGSDSHALGFNTTASGNYSHALGISTTASGDYSHALGSTTTASGDYSHALGHYAKALVIRSHALGYNTTASGSGAHALGDRTTASGGYSHALGELTVASGTESHAEGNATLASGPSSHALGNLTIANHLSQHVFGSCNIEDNSPKDAFQRGNYIEIVGNGTSNNARSNARTLDWSGNEWLAGTLTTNVNGIKIGNTTLNETQLQALLSLSLEITNPSNDDVLTYDSTSAKWINKAATIGGSSGMFVANVVYGENDTHLDKTVEEIIAAINAGKTVYIKNDDSQDDPDDGFTSSYYYTMLRGYTYYSNENSQTYWEFEFPGRTYTGHSLTDYPANTASGGLG